MWNVSQHFETIGRELAEVTFAGERARTSTRIALSVVLAVTLALWVELDDPWWAGISALMTSQATGPASVRRSILRVTGTAAGALIGYLAMGFIAYDQVAFCLFLFICSTIGMIGMSVSPHGYAWLLGGLTPAIVVTMAMTDPATTIFVAFDRFVEVTLGSLAALLMAALMASDDPEPVPVAPGWNDLLGAQWPAVQHAIRCGVTTMIVPFVWTWFDLPGLTQVAVTIAAVNAVPVTSNDPMTLRGVVSDRAILRITGCLGGGILGLLCLALSTTIFVFFLAILFGGIWICAHMQMSKRGIGYAGIQGSIVFIVTLVQGGGPPSSILPGIERFVGILGGLAVLLLISLAWPTSPADHRS